MSTDVSTPSTNLQSLALIVLSAVLWGTTDACMKYFTPAADNQKTSSTWFSLFLSLLSCPSYLLCLLINQCGSLVYYYTLAIAPLSLVNPTVNTGKVLVNALVGRVLGEEKLSWKKLSGLCLLLAGIILLITA